MGNEGWGRAGGGGPTPCISSLFLKSICMTPQHSEHFRSKPSSHLNLFGPLGLMVTPGFLSGGLILYAKTGYCRRKLSVSPYYVVVLGNREHTEFFFHFLSWKMSNTSKTERRG